MEEHTINGIPVDTVTLSPANHPDLYHIARGRDEGYPRCCIEWFVEVWSKVSRNHSVTGSWEESYFNAIKRFNYAPCPACLARKAVLDEK